MATTPLGKMVEGMVKAKSPLPEDGWTLGWDVVVSYDEEEINKTLKRNWEQHRNEMLADIDVTTDVPGGIDDSDDEEKATQRIQMELGTPLIQFMEGAAFPVVNLILPVVNGSLKRSDKKKTHVVPENAYWITITDIPLGTVRGKYDKVQKDNQERKLKPEPGDKECRFENKPPGEDCEVSWVVLDFSLETELHVKASFAPGIDPDKDPRGKRHMNNGLQITKWAASAFFEGNLETDFKPRFNLLRHALATVKDRTPTQDGVTVDLTPRTFRMATFKAEGTRSSLSLFIHVAGGQDRGETSNLQGKWGGQWLLAGTNTVAPIPEDHTASILFHPELVYEKVIAPSLQLESDKDEKYWILDRLFGYEGNGIAFNAGWQKGIHADKQYFSHKAKDIAHATYHLEVDPWSRDIKEIPAKIRFFQMHWAFEQDMDKHPVVRIEWKFDVNIRMFEWIGVKQVGYQEKEQATASRIVHYLVTLELGHNVPLSIKATDYDITITIDTQDLASNWKMADKEQAGTIWEDIRNLFTSPVWKSWVNAQLESTYESRRKVLAQATPKFEFGKMGLGFFLTTNLLNPGAKVIEIDTDVGMRMPGNMLLVGNIVQGEDSLKVSRA